jgi:diguanylate cyclase (GGDEF)-like protein/PAS domain S-box-containing protein
MFKSDRWYTICICLLTLILSVLPARALEQVNLQLKWTHAFQFAGYYAALDKGYYREAGLHVLIQEAKPGFDVVESVVSGKAQYGVGNSGLLLARNSGKPVVVLAVIFQHSPLVMVMRGDNDAQSIHDLIGKRVMIEPQSDELLAYLKQEGITPDRFVQVEHSFDPQDLISGRVDAISAYSTNEPFYLDRARLPYQVYTPRSVGIDFYGDNLFTSEQELREHPKRVAAFRNASLRGWKYAMEHPEEIARLIHDRYSSRHPIESYLFEAREMVPLFRQDLIEIGYMNPGRWRHIAEIYTDRGLLPHDVALEGFLFDPHPKVDLTRLYVYLGIALLAGTVVSAIALYIYRINRRLAESIVRGKQTEDALRTLSVAVEQSPVSVVITDNRCIISYVNPRFTLDTGYSSEEAIGRNPAILKSNLTEERVYSDLWDTLGKGMSWSGEFVNRRKDGELFHEEAHIAPVFDDIGVVTHYVAVKLDITERKRAEERITHLAQHDALTDLPNRPLFSDRLEQAVALAQRDGTSMALMFLDLDGFKPVNDTFGHTVGDLLLQEAAHRMRECVRASDTVGRTGGDEFVVLLHRIEDETDALTVAEKIRQALCRPFELAGQRLEISCSIGIAIYPEHGTDEKELSQAADSAMYCAKQEGRNRVRLFRLAEVCGGGS